MVVVRADALLDFLPCCPSLVDQLCRYSSGVVLAEDRSGTTVLFYELVCVFFCWCSLAKKIIQICYSIFVIMNVNPTYIIHLTTQQRCWTFSGMLAKESTRKERRFAFRPPICASSLCCNQLPNTRTVTSLSATGCTRWRRTRSSEFAPLGPVSG